MSTAPNHKDILLYCVSVFEEDINMKFIVESHRFVLFLHFTHRCVMWSGLKETCSSLSTTNSSYHFSNYVRHSWNCSKKVSKTIETKENSANATAKMIQDQQNAMQNAAVEAAKAVAQQAQG